MLYVTCSSPVLYYTFLCFLFPMSLLYPSTCLLRVKLGFRSFFFLLFSFLFRFFLSFFIFLQDDMWAYLYLHKNVYCSSFRHISSCASDRKCMKLLQMLLFFIISYIFFNKLVRFLTYLSGIMFVIDFQFIANYYCALTACCILL